MLPPCCRQVAKKILAEQSPRMAMEVKKNFRNSWCQIKQFTFWISVDWPKLWSQNMPNCCRSEETFTSSSLLVYHPILLWRPKLVVRFVSSLRSWRSGRSCCWSWWPSWKMTWWSRGPLRLQPTLSPPWSKGTRTTWWCLNCEFQDKRSTNQANPLSTFEHSWIRQQKHVFWNTMLPSSCFVENKQCRMSTTSRPRISVDSRCGLSTSPACPPQAFVLRFMADYKASMSVWSPADPGKTCVKHILKFKHSFIMV